MALQQKDKEPVAIGASIGALCRPCIEHHIPAGRSAGLSETELAQAVGAAQAIHRITVDLLLQRSHELLSGQAPAGAVFQAEPAQAVLQHATDITAGKAAAFIGAAGLNPAAVS